MGFSVSVRAFALVSSLLLGACGGGGGGGSSGAGGSTTAAPQAVLITETNAKPVAANALSAALNTSAGNLPIAVEVQTAGQTPNYFRTVGRAVRLASSGGQGATLATGVTTSQQCPLGGSFTLTADSVTETISFSNCGLDEGDGAVTMNGSLSVTLVSGGANTMPFNAVLSVVATEFSIVADGAAVVLSGDMRLDIAVTSTSETLVVSGSSLTTRFTAGATTHTDTLKNYSQSISFSGSVVTTSLSATVESTSTRLGARGGVYTITTPTPLVQNSTGALTAGVVKVVGANNSQLVMTVTGSNAVSIQVDANGDGTFETTVSSTVAELEALL